MSFHQACQIGCEASAQTEILPKKEGVSVSHGARAGRVARGGVAARAARLLGTEVILTGIRARVARTLVRLGTDLSGLNTRKTLQEGIDLALEYLKEGRQ